jgi:glutamate formiminotransferase/formiminotetrahydrofolate cyclodeaminase
MPRFADLSISSFLEALASAEPTPGGGTAAAVSGGIGTSLLMMVAGLPKSRGNTDDERVRLSEARAALAAIRDRLLTLADQDTAAYNEVLAAYRLPKASDAEKASRKAAIQKAMRAATDAPLETVRAICEATGHARTVARCGNPSAASDVRVALELLDASAAGGAANVEINLDSLDDESYRKATASTVLDWSNRLSADIAAARAALKDAGA